MAEGWGHSPACAPWGGPPTPPHPPEGLGGLGAPKGVMPVDTFHRGPGGVAGVSPARGAAGGEGTHGGLRHREEAEHSASVCPNFSIADGINLARTPAFVAPLCSSSALMPGLQRYNRQPACCAQPGTVTETSGTVKKLQAASLNHAEQNVLNQAANNCFINQTVHTRWHTAPYLLLAPPCYITIIILELRQHPNLHGISHTSVGPCQANTDAKSPFSPASGDKSLLNQWEMRHVVLSSISPLLDVM